MYLYKAYGLCLRTDLPLPELSGVSTTSNADVLIERRPLPPFPQEVMERSMLCGRIEGDDVHFAWKHSGRFCARAGREVYYSPSPCAPDSAVRAPFLGVVMGTLLHQRGLFTLHASAVRHRDGAIAFVGKKGAGKSTILAALHQAGQAVVTDDVLAVDVVSYSSSAPPLAVPAFPRIKMTSQTMDALDVACHDVEELHPDLDKYFYRAEAGFQHETVPLKRIYVLEDGPEIEVERLDERNAFLQLLQHSYAARFLGKAAAGPTHFSHCQAISKHVPVFRLQRPRRLSNLSRLASFIKAQA